MPFGIFTQKKTFAVCVGQDTTTLTDFLYFILFNGKCYYCLLLLLI